MKCNDGAQKGASRDEGESQWKASNAQRSALLQSLASFFRSATKAEGVAIVGF